MNQATYGHLSKLWVWLNGLLIVCSAYCFYFNSFREGGGGISALLISSGWKHEMEKKMKNIVIFNVFVVLELAAF